MTLARYAKDIPPDRWDSALFDKAWLGLSLGISVLIAVFGPSSACWRPVCTR